jgi:hypothetical protein
VGRDQKVYIVKQFSHRYDLVVHYLLVLILGEVLELLSRAKQVVHPNEGLLLGVVSVPCHEDV